LDLKVKTRSNGKIDIKYEFLDPKKTRKHMLISAVGQTVEKLSIWPAVAMLDFGPHEVSPHFREGHLRYFFKLTFKEDKSIEKQTFALHGHGSSPDDPTILAGIFEV
jgi:hypothetical protein